MRPSLVFTLIMLSPGSTLLLRADDPLSDVAWFEEGDDVKATLLPGRRTESFRAPPLLSKMCRRDAPSAMAVSSQLPDKLIVATWHKERGLRVGISRARGGRILSSELQFSHFPSLLLQDLDGDGTIELLVASERLRIFKVLDDRLEQTWESDERFDSMPPPKLKLADLDLDGHHEVLVLNYKHRDGPDDIGSLYLYVQSKSPDSALRLRSRLTFTDDDGYHSTSGLAVGDLMGDERLEIAVGNDNGWLWILDTDESQPAVKHHWQVPEGGAVGPGLDIGQLRSDPKQELLVGTNGGHIYAYSLADDTPKVLASSFAGRLAYGVTAADLDGDNIDEFVLSRGYLGYAQMGERDVVLEAWKLNGGQLSCGWRKETTGFPLSRVTPQDLDRDGTPELLLFYSVKENSNFAVWKPALSRADDIAALVTREDIQRLSLEDAGVRGDDLKQLQALEHLRELDLSGNAIVDDDLQHLAALQNLEEVNLINTNVTDAGLIHLTELPRLKGVTARYHPDSGITQKGMRKLRELIPGLRTSFITH